MMMIIDAVEAILLYCVPGYLALKLFQFLTSRKIKEHLIVASCVTSYVLVCVCETLFAWSSVYRTALASVVLGLAGAVVCAVCVRNKTIEEFLICVFGVSQDVDLLNNVLDSKGDVNLVIHPKHGEHYILGWYAGRDIKEGEQWIAIAKPQYFNPSGEKYYEFDDKNALYLCRVSDVEYMEVVK